MFSLLVEACIVVITTTQCACMLAQLFRGSHGDAHPLAGQLHGNVTVSEAVETELFEQLGGE